MPSCDFNALVRLAVDAWPALETSPIDGWLWRCSGGGSKRANSATTVGFTGGDLDASIDKVEALYRVRGQAARFQVEEISTPLGLAARLTERGYTLEEITVNMAKPVRLAAPAPGDDGCSRTGTPTPAWLAVYLSAITPDRRIINRRILQGVPEPRAFFLCRNDEGWPVSSGLCVASGPLGIIECMATAPHVRRSGGARRILAAIETWARQQGVERLFLQVVETNAPAVALYAQAGFSAVAQTRYFVRA